MSTIRPLRGKVFVHQLEVEPPAVHVAVASARRTAGKSLLPGTRDLAEVDAGHVPVNVGRIVALHSDDARRYGLALEDVVVYPQHAGDHPRSPTRLLGRANVHALARRFGLYGPMDAVLVIATWQVLCVLPDGAPRAGEMR